MYKKTIWLPRLGTGLNKFRNSGTLQNMILTPEPDNIEQEGTPFSAELMNNLEDGVEQAHESLILHETSDSTSELLVCDNSFTEYTALAEPLTVTLPAGDMNYGALLRVTLASGGSIAGFIGVSFVDGDDFTAAAEGETWEFSILESSVICKMLTAAT